MWKLKKINMLNSQLPTGCILSAAKVDEHLKANSIVIEAQKRAEQIINNAEIQANEYIAEQRIQQDIQFWQQANLLLNGWQQQRQDEEKKIIDLAKKILTQAMTQLLGEFNGEQRCHILLQNLLRSYSPEQKATLLCSSKNFNTINAWLNENSLSAWDLVSDPELSEHDMQLVTDCGELQISWSSLSHQLLSTI